MASEGETEAEEEEDWRFAVEDVGPDEADADSGSEERDAESDSMAPDLLDEAGAPGERPPLEPGSPSLENTLFVLLGVGLTLFVIVRVVTLTLG